MSRNTKPLARHHYNTRTPRKAMENDHQSYIEQLELMYRESQEQSVRKNEKL